MEVIWICLYINSRPIYASMKNKFDIKYFKIELEEKNVRQPGWGGIIVERPDKVTFLVEWPQQDILIVEWRGQGYMILKRPSQDNIMVEWPS